MSSNKFKASGSMPPWPSICKSKKKPKPKPPGFPPAIITVVLNLNWQNMMGPPGNWLGSVTCNIVTPGQPNWYGTLTTPQVNLIVGVNTSPTGALPRADVNGTIQGAILPLHYEGTATNSTSLVPFATGPITIDGPLLERPSTASAFG